MPEKRPGAHHPPMMSPPESTNNAAAKNITLPRTAAIISFNIDRLLARALACCAAGLDYAPAIEAARRLAANATERGGREN